MAGAEGMDHVVGGDIVGKDAGKLPDLILFAVIEQLNQLGDLLHILEIKHL